MYILLISNHFVVVAQHCITLCDPTDCNLGGKSGQEYWTGFPLPSPGDIPDSGVKPASPTLAGTWEALQTARALQYIMDFVMVLILVLEDLKKGFI